MGLFDVLFGKKSGAARAPQRLNIDNDYFLIEDGRLVEYRGKDDSIFVPRGVLFIGGHETPICNKTIDKIYIPNTVHRISDSALPYVETVYCEGSENSLSYDKYSNFYEDGWVPDWSRNLPHPIRVTKVQFYFEYYLYAKLEKGHFDEYPMELLPKTSK